MNRKNVLKILLPTFLLLTLLCTVSPAFAFRPPQKYVVVAAGYSQDQGEQTMKNNVLYVKGSVGVGVDYGYPWGDGTHVQTNYFYLNYTDYTGKLVGTIEKTFDGVTLKMVAWCEFSGVGVYTYHGQTIMVETPNGPVELTDGMELMGLLYSGGATGYTINNHHLITVNEKMTGVNVAAGPLSGCGIVVGTGTYIVIK